MAIMGMNGATDFMRRKDVILDNGDKFTLTELSSYGYSIGIRKWREPIDTEHFIIKTVNSTFDKENYRVIHSPIVIGEVYNTEKFSDIRHLRVLDCPIKFPGSNEYRIPRELNQFDEVIAKCAAHEHAINPNIDQFYAYITIDQMYIEANDYHRKSGCHVDGFQGSRIKPKRLINRSYIAYDRVPTVFYGQSFETEHLDEARHNFFQSFDEQAQESAELRFDPYSIVLMNAYSVHKSDKVNYPIYRTFFRLSYDVNRFDRFGNTHNPMFDYHWNMVTRDTKDKLIFKGRYNYSAL
jgi:hypothetical protein